MNWRGRAEIFSLFLLWYFSSASSVLLSKGLFSGRISNVSAFGFPLLITITSNIVCYFIACDYTAKTESNVQGYGNNRYALVIGILSAGEIGLKGLALKELTVTLSTMMKGAAPLFVLGWGVILRIYQPSCRLMSVVILVAAGLLMAVSGQRSQQTSSDSLFYGVVAAFVAGGISGLRWVVTQIFIKGESTLVPKWFTSIVGSELQKEVSPVQAILHTAPYTAFAVLPFCIILEGESLQKWLHNARASELLIVLAVAVIIGCCVFCYLWVGFELLKRTSSLTVSIGTVTREAMTIVSSIIVFGDHLTMFGFIGFSLIQIGILIYSLEKKQAKDVSRESIPLIDSEDHCGVLP